MPFPNLPNKHRGISLFNAKDFWKYKKNVRKIPEILPPKGVIFTFQPSLMAFIINNYPVKKVENIFGDFYLLEQTQGNIGICGNFVIGAPNAAILLEVFE